MARLRRDLGTCSGLVSLPERLGECTGLQRLELRGCPGLVSLPDLSGLAQLKVQYLPDQVKAEEHHD